jgi:hypothetical protein
VQRPVLELGSDRPAVHAERQAAHLLVGEQSDLDRSMFSHRQDQAPAEVQIDEHVSAGDAGAGGGRQRHFDEGRRGKHDLSVDAMVAQEDRAVGIQIELPYAGPRLSRHIQALAEQRVSCAAVLTGGDAARRPAGSGHGRIHPEAFTLPWVAGDRDRTSRR